MPPRTREVPTEPPHGAPRTLRLACAATLVLGTFALGGGGAIIFGGIRLLHSRDLGLGAVGLVIGLILVGVFLILPGLLYLLLAWPLRRGRVWANRLLIAFGSLHLLLALFCVFLALPHPHTNAGAAMIAALIALLLLGYVWCVLRCLGISKGQQSHLRGFEPVMVRLDAAAPRANPDRAPVTAAVS